MNVFLLGGTGYIGSAILKNLVENEYTVVALARSEESEQKLLSMGAEVVRGDIREPAKWSSVIHTMDAIIHTAVTFTEDMGDVDFKLVKQLVRESKRASKKIRFIYTGGNWLYGETGDHIATENTPFDPLPAFSWMIEHSAIITHAPNLEGMVIHPAMVYDRNGGVFERFIKKARNKERMEVIGTLDKRWPLVHRMDLAEAYRLVLEHGTAGESYNVATERGVPVSEIIRVLRNRFGVEKEPVIKSVADAINEQGSWVAGYALDQQMSSQKMKETLGWEPAVNSVLRENS